MAELSEFRIMKNRSLSKTAILEQLKAGDRIVAKKDSPYQDVKRCWLQKRFSSIQRPVFQKLLDAGEIEPAGEPDYDGTVYYKLKEKEEEHEDHDH